MPKTVNVLPSDPCSDRSSQGPLSIDLEEASGTPVFALMLICDFYKKLEKSQEALEVYTAALEKMKHLDVPLRFRIHDRMGACYRN